MQAFFSALLELIREPLQPKRRCKDRQFDPA